MGRWPTELLPAPESEFWHCSACRGRGIELKTIGERACGDLGEAYFDDDDDEDEEELAIAAAKRARRNEARRHARKARKEALERMRARRR